MNVGVARNVSTVNLVESVRSYLVSCTLTTATYAGEQGLFLPVIGLANTAATTYAIECAGGAEYVVSITINEGHAPNHELVHLCRSRMWSPISSGLLLAQPILKSPQ